MRSSSRLHGIRALSVALATLAAVTAASAQTTRSCQPPYQEAAIEKVTLTQDAAASLVLHVDDPNPPELVSGYNIYRSPDPSAPKGSWSLMAVDAGDTDDVAAGVQLVDSTGRPPAGRALFYVVSPYNGPCAEEGPWKASPTGDEDADGVTPDVDRCPATPEGAAVIARGCSATDLLLRPEVLAGPIDRGVEEFLAANAGRFVPDAVLQSLGLARSDLAAAADQLRGAQPCAASASFRSALSRLGAAVRGIEDYLAELETGGQATGSDGPGAQSDEGTEGTIVWPSPEILYWRGQHFVLSGLTAAAGQSVDDADQVCAAHGAPVTIQGRIRRISDDDSLVVLVSGERVVVAPGAVQQGRELMKEHADVAVEGFQYGNLVVGTLFQGALSSAPFLQGFSYDFCLELRVLPVQQLTGAPYPQPWWVRHPFEGYVGSGGALQLEAGDRLVAEDNACPGILAGSGPAGEDVRLEYWYTIRLDYQPKVGGWVNGYGMAGRLSYGMSSFPDMSSTTATLTIRKYKQTCLDTGFDIAILDPMSGNIVGTETQWNCSAEQLLSTTAYPVRMRDAHEYCWTDYTDTIFDIEDDEPWDWRPTQVQSVSVLATQVPVPVTFSATGDPIVNGSPVHNQPVGVGQPFAIYNPFGHAHWGLGTNQRSFLDWPHVTGTRNNSPFRYSCRTPHLLTDVIDSCSGTPWTFYRLPFPFAFNTSVSQGNGGSFSHNGWQLYALDLTGPEGAQIRAARGGTVVSVRTNMTLNCETQTCSNYGFPLLDEYGNHVAIQHQDGTVAWYAHMVPFSVAVSLSQKVKRGDYLGQLGNTGKSTGPHLHIHVTPEDPGTWGNQTILSRYRAYRASTQTIETCMVPQQGETYLSTNVP